MANTTIRVNCKPVELPTFNLIIFRSHEDIQPIIDASRHKDNLKEAHEVQLTYSSNALYGLVIPARAPTSSIRAVAIDETRFDLSTASNCDSTANVLVGT